MRSSLGHFGGLHLGIHTLGGGAWHTVSGFQVLLQPFDSPTRVVRVALSVSIIMKLHNSCSFVRFAYCNWFACPEAMDCDIGHAAAWAALEHKGLADHLQDRCGCNE